MKKLNLKSYLAGIISTILVIALIFSVSAATITKTLNATFKDIKISVNGDAITPKDANGKTIEPFIVDGSTYLPVRAVADAVGYDVTWDDKTNTAKLTGDFIMIDPVLLAVKETFVNTMANIGLRKDFNKACYEYAQSISTVKGTKEFKDFLIESDNIFYTYGKEIEEIEKRMYNPILLEDSYKSELNNLEELKKMLENLSEKTALFGVALHNFADVYDNKTSQQLTNTFDELEEIATEIFLFSFRVQSEIFLKLEK